jgi:hypothetical protein
LLVAVVGLLKDWRVVTGVAGAAGAAACGGAEGARAPTPLPALRCTRCALVTGFRCGTKCSDRVVASCVEEAVLPTGSEARSLTGAGRSAATRPAAPPITANSGVGSPWTPTPESRKTQSEIPIAATKMAETVGD